MFLHQFHAVILTFPDGLCQCTHWSQRMDCVTCLLLRRHHRTHSEETMARRDYNLLGADARRAVDSGLAAAEWYHTEVARKDIKALMQRSNQPAIRDTIVLYGAMIALATIGWQLWPSLWSVPFWLAYGVLNGSASDSRWHECGHGTAFRTPWLNTWVYQIASFMMIRNPVTWRWSHARHHTDTYIVGRDPEIAVMRPPVFTRLIANFAGLVDAWNGWGRMLLNASGRIAAEEASFIPASEQPKVIAVARVWHDTLDRRLRHRRHRARGSDPLRSWRRDLRHLPLARG